MRFRLHAGSSQTSPTIGEDSQHAMALGSLEIGSLISLNLQVHKLCQTSADQILNTFHPNLMIAIGGGGYVPARILRYAA